VIIDLPRFLAAARPSWEELERMLDRFAAEPDLRLDIDQAQRFYYLYQRCAADLGMKADAQGWTELRTSANALFLRGRSEIWRRARLAAGALGLVPTHSSAHLPAPCRRVRAAVGVTIAGCAFEASRCRPIPKRAPSAWSRTCA
jgi:hypothetical protein